MNPTTPEEIIVDNGRQLLDEGLVARTWGNISCRLDEDNCVVTPSGLDYRTMRTEDIVKVNIRTGEWWGAHRPSGEIGIHIAAYKIFSHVNYVIHTHQTYATAIGLAGFDSLDITCDEGQRLNGLGLAAYGLPGTKKLRNNVGKVLSGGKETVLMAHHGAMICGKTREEAMARALLLEEICKRNVRKTKGNAALICADKHLTIFAQIDDMAQMIGSKIPIVDMRNARAALGKKNAVLVPGLGAMVYADNDDDREALALLVEKACICRLHTDTYSIKGTLAGRDVARMHYIYRHKYSKQKNRD